MTYHNFAKPAGEWRECHRLYRNFLLERLSRGGTQREFQISSKKDEIVPSKRTGNLHEVAQRTMYLVCVATH